MSLCIHLLGRPHISGSAADAYQFRSRKSWALLAYLLLAERPPARSQLAGLLFPEAEDPLRALRWNLSEVRRGLGASASVDGDPVVLQLAEDVQVDLEVVFAGSWSEAVALPGFGRELLEDMTVQGAAVYDTWLLSKQRHVAAASEAILHEAALSAMSRGSVDIALDFAVRAAAMSPLDENHQALLIRLYRRSGDDEAAARQFELCSTTYARELGTSPGHAVVSAMRATRDDVAGVADDDTIAAVIEAGAAAVAAGAIEAGIASLRTAARLADDATATKLRVSCRLVLAEALIHSLGGLDEEGLATLHEADEIARTHGMSEVVAQVRAELGYVDFLRARYDRAEVWLTDALAYAEGAPATSAKATTYLGAVESDRANYPRALVLLEQAVALSRVAGDPRREAFALSMLGRLSLLQGDLVVAAERLDAAVALAEREHWLAFLPWPQALTGHLRMAQGDLSAAEHVLRQAFARACQLGDPCWEAMSVRGLGLHAEATGEPERAFDLLADARARCNRLADPYVWLDGYILDAQCELGRRHHHPEVRRWVADLRALASRTGMKELTVRSLLHGAALGQDGDAAVASLLTGREAHDGVTGEKDGCSTHERPAISQSP